MIENFVVVGGLGKVHKVLFLLFYFLFLLYLKNRGGGGRDVAPVARVAIGRGCVNGGYLGRGMPTGTTNPS